ncbi:hypothetical protein A3709_09415 [Halioglobus sp. HI00S01]|uniref:DUF4892 domain-containing protein n=1 Tax=Halioglobus sp. HI00S01 TaxID=1822214 RepID=UPI0007C3400A|nr:DUF4892 domain-containing protein [Halioglobus sp. HI00S01]KZX53344.1 hypothetical protein A3709_09415 [Halioglobus sp. HI00S01]
MRSSAGGVHWSLLAVLLLMTLQARAEPPHTLLETLDASPHMQQVSHSSDAVIEHEIGLGAMQKIRGSWRFKGSERVTGERVRYTWQVRDGFTSNEVLDGLEAQLNSEGVLFACEGRSCGQGVQWANRVFGERVLYGRDDLQRYRVYDLADADQSYRLVLFSSARTADRQYLHAELYRIVTP